MKALEAYREAKHALTEAERWYALIGKEYMGGTRGRGGEYGRVRKCTVAECVVYYQAYDGATNYHNIPDKLRHSLGVVLVKHAPGLLAEALEAMRQTVAELAEEAAKEYKTIMDDAGAPMEAEESASEGAS